MSDDVLRYREHAEKIRHLLSGVSGQAATSGLLLAKEYEARADQLEGRPLASAYLGNIDRVGEMIAAERELVGTLIMSETDLTSQLATIKQKRLLAEARIEAILHTVMLFDTPNKSRNTSAPDLFKETSIHKTPNGRVG